MMPAHNLPIPPITLRTLSRMNRRSGIVASMITGLLLLGGCTSNLDIPKPDASQPTPPPPLEPSVVLVPVGMSLGQVSAEIEKVVPKNHRASSTWTVVENNPIGDMGVKYEVWRDPLQLVVRGNSATVTGKLYYWMQVAQNIPKPLVGGSFWQELASCGRGEQPRQATVGLQSAFTWSPEWRLTSATTLRPTEFLNKCQVTVLKIDVTNRVNTAFEAGLRQGARLVDERVKALGDFRRYGEQAWRELRQPIRLDSNLWLLMEPHAAHVSSLNSVGDKITATIGLTAQPRIVYGPKPPATERQLPQLETRGTGDGLHVTVEGDLSFADANRELTKAVVGKTFKVTGHDVKVLSATLWGSGDKVVVQLGLGADINGTIYFIGTPAYDPKSNMLYIRELDYSLETKAALAKIADWMNHEGFRQSIAEQARFPLSDYIGQVRSRLETAMNRSYGSNVTARGKVNAIRPVGVYLTPTGFKARVAIDGNLSLDLK